LLQIILGIVAKGDGPNKTDAYNMKYLAYCNIFHK